MTEPAGGARLDYSTGPRASRAGVPTLSPLVLGLLFAAMVGAVLLIIGLLVFPMVFGAAVGRSRPAMAAIAVVGLAALLVALIGDAPDIHKTGVFGQNFEDAQADPKSGYYLETLGAVLVLIGGACSWVLTRARPAGEPAAAPARAAAEPPAPEN